MLGLLGHLDISAPREKCSKTADHATNISVCLEMLRVHQYDQEFTPVLSSTLHEVRLWQRSLTAQPGAEYNQLYLVTRALDNVLQAARMYAAFPDEDSNRLLVISALIDLLQLIQMLNDSTPSTTNPAIYLAGFC
jgi:hypothetical protein